MIRLRTRVKICGITRIEDGIAAATAGADAIGFVFWPGSPRRVDVARARAIVDAMPPFLSCVGLFVDPSEEDVRAIRDHMALAMLQFHGSEPPEFCRAFGIPYIKAFPVRPGASGAGLLESAARYADAAGWLFDAPSRAGLPGGTGRSFDWAALPADPPRPLILSGGLDPANVAAAIRAVRPWAVDVSSGVEIRGADGTPVKGRKDPSRIAAFLQEVTNAHG